MTVFLFLWAVFIVAYWIAIFLVLKIVSVKILILRSNLLRELFSIGKQLPFDDIQTIGLNHLTITTNAVGSAQAYSNSHGSKIEITGWVPLAPAEAVSNDIKKVSCCTWN